MKEKKHDVQYVFYSTTERNTRIGCRIAKKKKLNKSS